MAQHERVPMFHPEIHQLACLYAHAIDNNLPDVLEKIFTEDAVIEGPGFVMNGRARILQTPGKVARDFKKTLHFVHNYLATLDGDRGSGELYSIAYHLPREDAPQTTLIWYLRYLDKFERKDGVWRYSRRQLVVMANETVPLGMGGEHRAK